MNITIKEEYINTPVLSRLFDFYIKSGLDADAGDRIFGAAAKDFEGRASDQEKTEIATVSLELHPEMFNLVEHGDMDRFELYYGFDAFCKKVYLTVTKDKPEEISKIGVSRSKLPRLAAFDMIGNNDMQISSEPADYALGYGS